MEKVDKLLAMYDSYMVKEHSYSNRYVVEITLIKNCWYKPNKSISYDCFKDYLSNRWNEREDSLDMRKRCLRHFGY